MRIASSPMVYGTNAIHVTVSIGVASAPDDGISSPADLIARADEALYQAKAHGRNQVHPRHGTLSDEKSGELVLAHK